MKPTRRAPKPRASKKQTTLLQHFQPPKNATRSKAAHPPASSPHVSPDSEESESEPEHIPERKSRPTVISDLPSGSSSDIDDPLSLPPTNKRRPNPNPKSVPQRGSTSRKTPARADSPAIPSSSQTIDIFDDEEDDEPAPPQKSRRKTAIVISDSDSIAESEPPEPSPRKRRRLIKGRGPTLEQSASEDEDLLAELDSDRKYCPTFPCLVQLTDLLLLCCRNH